jgi:hypothetical protein
MNARLDKCGHIKRLKSSITSKPLQLTAINREKKHVHEVPGVNAIERWIEEAKALPRIVSY